VARNIAQGRGRGLSIVGHSIYSVLLPLPIVCFLGALVTDLAYSNSEEFMWLDFSSWLLLAGLVTGGIAGLILIIEVLGKRRDRSRALWLHLGLLAAAWGVEVVNSFVHTRDGWTAVVPTGLTLSFIAVVLSLLAGWFWQSASGVPTGGPA
jgi:uncharacterized membrane protein